jgi:hypothetical protein
MDNFKRIIEINGVKVEVDLRTAKRVDEFKVGDKVKLLKKNYGDTFESHYGILIGFDEFKNLPTMIIAYLTYDDIKFEYINTESKTAEICHLNDHDFLNINVTDILRRLGQSVAKKQEEIDQLNGKINYLKDNIGKIFKLEIKENNNV